MKAHSVAAVRGNSWLPLKKKVSTNSEMKLKTVVLLSQLFAAAVSAPLAEPESPHNASSIAAI